MDTSKNVISKQNPPPAISQLPDGRWQASYYELGLSFTCTDRMSATRGLSEKVWKAESSDPEIASKLHALRQDPTSGWTSEEIPLDQFRNTFRHLVADPKAHLSVSGVTEEKDGITRETESREHYDSLLDHLSD